MEIFGSQVEGVVLDRQRTDKELDALADLYLTGPDEQTSVNPVQEAMAIGAQRDQTTQRRKAPPGSFPSNHGSPAPGSSPARSSTSDSPDDRAMGGYFSFPEAVAVTRSTGLMTGPTTARLGAKVSQKPSADTATPHFKPAPPTVDDDDATSYDAMNDQQTQSPQHDEPTLRLVNLELEAAITAQGDPPPMPTSETRRALDAGSDQTPSSSVLAFDDSVVFEDRRVEVVFLGNLPGFASPWMTQYAQHVALECGVVGVLHIDDEQIDLDFVSTPANRAKLDAVHRQIMDFDQAQDLIAVLDLLNQGAEPAVGAWLIHLATPLTATTQTIARSLPVWTLLSGVDEAAGARAMDWLSHCLEQAHPQEMDHVQFMAMGCDIDRAVSMIRQLDERALEQWDTPIELVGVQRQMVPVHLQTLGSFPTMLDQWSTIVRLIAGDSSAADHRSALVTRIDSSKHTSQPQLPEQEPVDTADTQQTDQSSDAAITAEEARNLLMAAAKLDGIQIQGVELDDVETEEPIDEDELAPEPIAAEEAPEILTDSLATLEYEADHISDETVTAKDIDTHAVPSDPQPEVVSQTVRDFVERLKREEIRKRQQAQADEAGQTRSDRPAMDDQDDADHVDESEPMTVAQLAEHSQAQQEVHAQIVGPRQHKPQASEPVVTARLAARPTPASVAAEKPQPKPTVQPTREPEHLNEPSVVHHEIPHQHTGQPHLASYLNLPGAVSLTARCPQHPEVELVLDDDGGLHLLARHQQADDSTVRDAMYQLLDARGWVDQHVLLLSMTQKQLRFDLQIRPVVHLFTDDARGAAQLVAHSARFVKLHLLTEVVVADNSAFYCTELN